MSRTHGVNIEVIAPRSRFYHGPFGRLCSNLPAWTPPSFDANDEVGIADHFFKLANQEMVERPGLKPADIARDATIIQELENEFSSNIPAGYTYFGQFIDHDITFDPASSLQRQNDPNGLLNHRTPRLDLDNVYGRGPANSPYLYSHTDTNAQGKVDKFLIGKIKRSSLTDLPRNAEGRALIGDMRNDENSIVSQLQLAFLRAHNALAQRARDMGIKDTFNAARKTLRWLYQYIVWNDFIKRIANDEIYRCALTLDKGQSCAGVCEWQLGFGHVYNWKNQPFMPVEFSVAAYRFGHSMVRNSYQTNHPHRGAGSFVPIFDNVPGSCGDDLRGFRAMTEANSIQWDWFLEMKSSREGFPQFARKIDTKLSNGLSFLFEEETGSPLNVLAFRNLLRSWRFSLPSGTDLARKFCIKPIDIDPDKDALWFYILQEAESLPGKHAGQMLGRLGSLIVCATFAGLLKGDPNSWFNVDPCWHPDQDPLLKPDDHMDSDDWTLASIIRLSDLPVSDADF